MVKVTFWTDWAIPTASFDLTLRPNDVQTFDVRDVLMVGAPATFLHAPGLCTGALKPGTLHFNSGIPKGATLAEGLANLRNAHSGEPFAAAGKQYVASSSTHPGVAVGYITLDVVNRCFAGFPSSPNYFLAGGFGIASNLNSIVGDFILLDNQSGRAEAEPAVHIRASSAFQKKEYTFYGRFTYPSASDGRQPLGNSYGSRYFVAFPPNPAAAPETDLLVWRDIKCAPGYSTAPLEVGDEPYWLEKITTQNIIAYDENRFGANTSYNFGLATQRVPVDRPGGIATPYNAGWLRISLNHRVPYGEGGAASLFGNLAQGWVTTVWRANVVGSPASAAFRSFRISTVCK
jgi:hypothetical protein